jgi:hypothetical protein
MGSTTWSAAESVATACRTEDDVARHKEGWTTTPETDRRVGDRDQARLRRGLRQLVIGATAAVVTYALGGVFGATLG